MSLRPTALYTATTLLLAACAMPVQTAESRWLVKLSAEAARGKPDAATIAGWASHSAATPVRYAAAVSPLWHALALRCQPADCAALVRRLAADTRHFDSIEADGRQRALPP